MKLSRRGFFTYVAAATAAARLECSRARCAGATGRALSTSIQRSHTLILDIEERCTLRESLAGFVAGLAAAGAAYKVVHDVPSQCRGLLLVPGATLRDLAFAWSLRAAAERGATVLYESGAAYAMPETFVTEQLLLARCFGVAVQPPVDLWTGRSVSSLPYVRYAWPINARVRDFSRIIPTSNSGSGPMAVCGEIAAACRRRIGRGVFIFLGSPLGPPLRAEDREARAWLEALLAA